MLTSGIPMIVRLAGLPASTLDALGNDRYRRHLEERAGIEEKLAEARRELADRLYEKIPQAPPELRPRLLALRRDCHNGRGLLRPAAAPPEDALLALCGGLYATIVGLEQELRDAAACWQEEFELSRSAQRRQLIALLDDDALVRGLALAAPELIANVHRLRKDFAAYGRKERGLEASLLRYVSRAASKTSPYSTLGRLALAVTDAGDLGGRLQLDGEGWAQQATLRLKRFLIDQNVDLLCRLPAFRRGLRLVVNDSAENAGDGSWRYLRPGFWAVDPQSKKLSYTQDAIVKVRLGGPLVAWLEAELPRRKTLYGELGSVLAAAFPEDDASQLLGFVDKLLEIGFLCLLKPWPANAARAEVALADYLRQAEPPGELGRMADLVDRILELEASFAGGAAPLSAIDQLKAALADLWRINLGAAGLDPEIENGLVPKGNFYEDVFLRSPGERPVRQPGDGAILRVPAEQVEGALRHLEPLARLSDLYSRRYDFLHAVDAFMERHWPGTPAVKFLDLFQKGQGLWEEFTEFQTETRRASRDNRWKETFRPADSAAAAGLAELREAVWNEVESTVSRRDEGTFISSELLAGVVARIPNRYRHAGICLFLQKAAADGDLWVLNRIFEGIGRFGSRYTSVMDEPTGRVYAAHFRDRGEIGEPGEEAELLDLMRVQGDTLNVHAVQTPKILANPGDWIDVEPDRRLALRDLYVRRDPATGLPRLTDAAGKRYLPVHLGGASHLYAPLVLRFLATFGPGEFRSVAPARGVREAGGLRDWHRLVIGNVVLNRRKWGFPPQELRAAIAGLDDAAAFLAIHRWRLANGIPEKVFLIEGFVHKYIGLHYKPQLIDFGSTLFMSIFRSALAESEAPILAVEEALPDPEAAPRDAAGRPWTVELMVDSLAFRQPRNSSGHELRQSEDCRRYPSPIPAEDHQREPSMAR